MDPVTGFDIWALPFDGERTPRPLIRTRFNETHPALSPEGRWLAHVSDESERYEVYVRSYPAASELLQISMVGGFEPLWLPRGDELYYRLERDGGTVMAVSFQGGPNLTVGKPRVLFEARHPDGSPRFEYGMPYGRNYDVSPDGRRFLMLERKPDPPITRVRVVLEWSGELGRLVPLTGSGQYPTAAAIVHRE